MRKIESVADPLERARMRVDFVDDYPEATEETILHINTAALNDLALQPDKLLEARAYINMSYCYSTLGYYMRSFEYDQKAYSIGVELGSDKIKAITLNNLGNSYSDLGKREEALSYFQRALEINLANAFGIGFLAANYSNIVQFISTIFNMKKHWSTLNRLWFIMKKMKISIGSRLTT